MRNVRAECNADMGQCRCRRADEAKCFTSRRVTLCLLECEGGFTPDGMLVSE
jgi:hypothetical protein